MIPRVCVSIMPTNILEAIDLIGKAEERKADLVEVRLDLLESSVNLADIVKNVRTSLIATNKLKSEKGLFAGTEAERQQSLLKAARSGFDYIDLDLSSPTLKETVQILKESETKTILSFHKWDGVLSTSAMTKVLKQEIESGASICKIITTAERLEDNLTTLNFVSRNANKAKLVCFCTGEVGKVSRLLSPLFGAFFTFASLESSGKTAIGQMTIQEMKSAYRLLEA